MASLQPDKPPTPKPIDLRILEHNGSTSAIGYMPDTLQRFKAEPTPSLKQMIEALSKENGRLRVELAYYRKLQGAAEELRDEVDYIIERLRMAIRNFRKGHNDLKKEFGETCTKKSSHSDIII
jgi:hypothetical protein